jgi:transposase
VAERRHELSDAQWEAVRGLLPGAKPTGRPPRPARDMLNGMMWILATGAPWRDMPERYGPWETVYSRFRHWTDGGVIDRVLARLQLKLDRDGYIDWEVVFIDGSSVRAAAAAAGAPKKRLAKSRRITR